MLGAARHAAGGRAPLVCIFESQYPSTVHLPAHATATLVLLVDNFGLFCLYFATCTPSLNTGNRGSLTAGAPHCAKNTGITESCTLPHGGKWRRCGRRTPSHGESAAAALPAFRRVPVAVWQRAQRAPAAGRQLAEGGASARSSRGTAPAEAGMCAQTLRARSDGNRRRARRAQPEGACAQPDRNRRKMWRARARRARSRWRQYPRILGCAPAR